MIKAAFILAASAAALGLATLSVAQESTDEQFMPVPTGGQENWFLQRSTCTLAHNVNGDSVAVVRFRIAMGVEIEFLDPALRNVRQGASAEFDVAVDGASEWGSGMGIVEDGRRGYRLGLASYEIIDRLAAGRRLEARTGGRALLQLDLAGAAPAIAALRACYDAMVPVPVDGDMNMVDAMENAADALDNAADAARNAASPEG